ncbi:MAG: ferritin-like domain-containing protein [Myxococcota bacterium]|nr:ferritin-like domain-containing protein [Myxococcota bacterium]
MKRRAIRRSQRMHRIFRHHQSFVGIRTTILTAMGVAALGCTPESGPSDDTPGAQGTAGVTVDRSILGRGGLTAPTAGDSTSVATDGSAGVATLVAGTEAPTAGTVDAPRGGAALVSAGTVASLGGMPSGPMAGDANGGGMSGAGLPAGGRSVVAPMAACRDGVGRPILDPNGDPTGVEQCQDKTRNRVESLACAPILGGRDCMPEEVSPNERTCDDASDCNDRPNGKCMMDGGAIFPVNCACRYPCETDDDCGRGQVCLCANVRGASAQCVPAGCRTNADCDSGECAIQFINGCPGELVVQCRTDRDTCRTDADCPDGQCGFRQGRFACEPPGPVCGRPLIVAGETRLGHHAERSDWCAGDGPGLNGISLEMRTRLGRFWREVAALEYASVASFSRFNLQLMALGAPPELLLETQRATMDEIEHTQLAYGMVSAYEGKHIGPAPFELAGVNLETDPAQIMRSLLDEACVGEVLGAAEAQVAAEHAHDPFVRQVFERIAREETAHASLAWRTLSWMLDAWPALRQDAANWLADLIAGYLRRETLATPHHPEHGLIGAREKLAVYRTAIETVVVPLARELGLTFRAVG